MNSPFTSTRTWPGASLKSSQRRGGVPVSLAFLFGLTGLVIGFAATRPPSQVEPATSQVAGGSLAMQKLTNQQRFDALNGNDLEELRNRQRRFEQFPEPRQKHLRELHEQWSANPDRENLLDTMKQYTQWLKSLKAEQRALIKSASGEERVKLVSDIRQEQAEAIFGVAGETQLPKEDVSVLFQWSREFLESRNNEIVDLFRNRNGSSTDSNEGRRGGGRGFESRPDMLFLILGRNNIDSVVALIREDDISRLSSQLSPAAVTIIESQGKVSDKQKLIYRWIVTALEALRNPKVPQRDLEEFFATEMPSEQRQLVESMTPESRLQMIRSFYFARNRQRLAPGVFPPPEGPDFRPPRGPEPRLDTPPPIDKF